MGVPRLAGRVGVDTGGTFTDVVGEDGGLLKLPSTPADPSRAVAAGLDTWREGSGAESISALAHGTTVVTNALLERKGAVVALVTNDGFSDVIEIARQNRPSLYDMWADRPEPLVPRELRFEAAGRLGPDGAEVEPLDLSNLPAVPPEVEVVALCLLHSDLNPSHEEALAAALARPGLVVRTSAEVSPEFREYERTVTTVIDAYLGPACATYMERLRDLAGEVLVMTSAGGLVRLEEASSKPASLLVSGPAGGVRAAAEAAVSAGFPDAVTFDMGGTSTDVCLVQAGVPEPAAERVVAGFPVRLPALDVHTIGAGGGSIAGIDAGDALFVGPRSAGAEPGPACYGRGGSDPTVTDANLVAGRIPTDARLPGIGPLDAAAGRAALDRAGVSAQGVIDVVNASMVQAIRAVSIERGVDPRGLALVAFGGAGPLHACALAEALDMVAVVVPPRAGVLSAVGLIGAPRQVDLVRSWARPAEHEGLEQALKSLAQQARGALAGSSVTTVVDCRYAGQSHEMTVGSVSEFEAEHRRRNGYTRPGDTVEVVALRARASAPGLVDTAALGAPAPRRAAVGPCSLAEPDCTVWLPEAWRAEVGDDGSWVLRR
jgi:N-methylhydantoinase A/oxoprolinase/acetone carboxylase beta subunit